MGNMERDDIKKCKNEVPTGYLEQNVLNQQQPSPEKQELCFGGIIGPLNFESHSKKPNLILTQSGPLLGKDNSTIFVFIKIFI